MDSLLYNAIYYSGLLVTPFVVYSIFFRKNQRSKYSNRDWLYLIKFYIAKKQVEKYQEKYRIQHEKLEEDLQIETGVHSNSHNFYGVDQNGNSLTLKFALRASKLADLSLHLQLANGSSYVLPGKNRTLLDNISKNQWSIGGANIEVLEELKRLRITFNGLLTNISKETQEMEEHVQFNFIFTAAGSPSYVPQDIEKTLLTRALATDAWRDGSWIDNLADQTGIVQFGALKGFVRGDAYPEEYVMNLTACRSKFKGIDENLLVDRAIKIYLADAYGNMFHIVIKSLTTGCSQLNYGFAYLSNNTRFPIEDIDIRLADFAHNKVVPEVLTCHLKVKKTVYKCVLHLNTSKVVKFLNDHKYGYEYMEVPAECEVNLNQGRALVEFWYSHDGDDIFIPEKKMCARTVQNVPSILVSDIKNEDSQMLELAGGKGNSLALLTSLNSEDYTVPDGFIVTTQAYKLQVGSDPILANSILFLNDICCGKKDGKLEEACQRTTNYFKNNKLLPEIVEAIAKELEKHSKDASAASWAVRSSAIGEDSEELSAAGQNETFLGCRNEEEILQAVLSCWASLYTYQSVQYRWQHGLSIDTDMAVVVQKMVPADCAGVLFTCHPSTSNPSRMVITSNFGLGETVVSGVSDPDTLILGRSWDNKIRILEKNVGRKNSILAMTSTGATEMYSEENNNDSWSLTDQQALQLGKIGVLLEKAFGSPRDIEWAFYQDKLYLLQSRPITTLNTWTDFELSHEMDTPLLTDKAILSVGNVKEVIPRAATVLSQTSSLQCTNKAMQIFSQKNEDPLSQRGIITFEHNIMIDVAASVHRNVSNEIQVISKVMDLAIFGHAVLDEQMNEILLKTIGVPPTWDRLKEIYRLFDATWRNKETIVEAKRLVDNLRLEMRDDEAIHVKYDKIDEALDDIFKVAVCHTKTSAVSVFLEMITMMVLLEGQKELTMDHLSDFTLILSSCEDVISAEVPKNLEEIAQKIKEHSYASEFCQLKPETGVEWLEKTCPEINKLLDTFLRKHGHRSLGEFEVIEESWAENPSKVISMIQTNIKHERNTEKTKMSLEDISKNLVSPKGTLTRVILRFLMKKMRVSVGIREQTKSELVRAFDKLRSAYRHLSQQMVLHGLLPSKDLIYHLTHKEIRRIIHNRSPALISKAVRRRKLYTKWDKLRFPEIMFGIPVPEDDAVVKMDSLENTFKGTPVCIGIVQARACVINNLDEIHQLQTGDILITYSTDIGWSPYFPMLSGIVTELGGLISHGAVVAREYGLPSVVGIKNVTKYFKTGDIVILNGNTGELGKM